MHKVMQQRLRSGGSFNDGTVSRLKNFDSQHLVNLRAAI